MEKFLGRTTVETALADHALVAAIQCIDSDKDCTSELLFLGKLACPLAFQGHILFPPQVKVGELLASRTHLKRVYRCKHV